MPNMSYCRFENTYRDLLDCLENMGNDLSESEHQYRKRLVDVCKEIVDEWEIGGVSEMEWEDDNNDE